jgi:hypothetical protein
MGGLCSTHGDEKTRKEEAALGLDGRIILKWVGKM